MKFDIWIFKKKLCRRIQFPLKSDKNNSTLHADRHTFVIICRSVSLRMINVSKKGEEIKTHFVFSNFSPKIVPSMR
jgi:hypothetical protein